MLTFLPAVALAGCLPGGEGPSIPTNRTAPQASVAAPQGPKPAAAAIGKRAFQRRGAKVQAAPRVRTPIVE